MKNILLVFLSVFAATFSTKAQNILNHIPKNANFVMTIHGNQWLQLASIPYFENTAVGKEFIKELRREFDNVNSISDLGIDFTGNSYFYMTSNDTISFFNIAMPINNLNNFQALLSEMFNYEDTRIPIDTTIWIDDFYFRMNEKIAFFHIPIFAPTIYARKYPNNRFGLTTYYDNDYYGPYAPAEAYPAIEETTPVDIAVEYYDEKKEPELVKYGDDIPVPEVKVAKEPVIYEPQIVEVPAVKNYDVKAAEEDYVIAVAPVDDYEGVTYTEGPPAVATASDWEATSYDYSSYDKYYREQDSLKKLLFDAMYEQMIFPYHSNNHNLSTINKNKFFKKAYDKNAMISVYMDGPNNLYNYLYSIFGISQKAIISDDIDYLSMNTYMNNDEITVKSLMKVNAASRKQFRKLTNRKLNKNLLSYYDKNKVIGGFSFAYNTEHYLQYVSKELKNYYYDYFIKKEDVAIISDVLALLIDEKAIGKAIKGDGLFLINDVKPTKVSYVSYEYNEEDFRSVQVRKEKTETLPELLLMYSTDDPTIHRKLMNYFEHKGLVSSKHGIYTIVDKYNDFEPFQWHFMVKDGIVFFSNSLETIQQINLGKYNKSIDCKTKRFVRKNAMTGFFYPEKLHNKISTGNLNIDGELNAMILKLDDVKMNASKFRCGKMKSKLSAKVPKSQENGLKYIINGINALFDLSKI